MYQLIIVSIVFLLMITFLNKKMPKFIQSNQEFFYVTTITLIICSLLKKNVEGWEPNNEQVCVTTQRKQDKLSSRYSEGQAAAKKQSSWAECNVDSSIPDDPDFTGCNHCPMTAVPGHPHHKWQTKIITKGYIGGITGNRSGPNPKDCKWRNAPYTYQIIQDAGNIAADDPRRPAYANGTFWHTPTNPNGEICQVEGETPEWLEANPEGWRGEDWLSWSDPDLLQTFNPDKFSGKINEDKINNIKNIKTMNNNDLPHCDTNDCQHGCVGIGLCTEAGRVGTNRGHCVVKTIDYFNEKKSINGEGSYPDSDTIQKCHAHQTEDDCNNDTTHHCKYRTEGDDSDGIADVAGYDYGRLSLDTCSHFTFDLRNINDPAGPPPKKPRPITGTDGEDDLLTDLQIGLDTYNMGSQEFQDRLNDSGNFCAPPPNPDLASCTATDQNDAAAVTLCEAVALDGSSLTCTSAGPCRYTEEIDLPWLSSESGVPFPTWDGKTPGVRGYLPADADRDGGAEPPPLTEAQATSGAEISTPPAAADVRVDPPPPAEAPATSGEVCQDTRTNCDKLVEDLTCELMKGQGWCDLTCKRADPSFSDCKDSSPGQPISDGGGGGDPCQGDGVILGGDTGTLSFITEWDEVGGGGYPNNADCSWHISCSDPDMVPTFTFTEMDTEGGWDWVDLYDGAPPDPTPATGGDLGHFSGGLADLPQPSYQAGSSAMTINFTSDNSTGDRGFEGNYSCATPPPTQAPQCDDPYTGQWGEGERGDGGCGAAIYAQHAYCSAQKEVDDCTQCTPTGQDEIDNDACGLESPPNYYSVNKNSCIWDNDYGKCNGFWVGSLQKMYTEYLKKAQQLVPKDERNDSPDDLDAKIGCRDRMTEDECSGPVSQKRHVGDDRDNQDWLEESCTWTEGACTWITPSPGMILPIIRDGWNAVAKHEQGNCADSTDGCAADLARKEIITYVRDPPPTDSQGNKLEGAGDSINFVKLDETMLDAASECVDHLEEVSGKGACDAYMAQGYTCDLRFCPTCSFAHMCDKTCGICTPAAGAPACDDPLANNTGEAPPCTYDPPVNCRGGWGDWTGDCAAGEVACDEGMNSRTWVFTTPTPNAQGNSVCYTPDEGNISGGLDLGMGPRAWMYRSPDIPGTMPDGRYDSTRRGIQYDRSKSLTENNQLAPTSYKGGCFDCRDCVGGGEYDPRAAFGALCA